MVTLIRLPFVFILPVMACFLLDTLNTTSSGQLTSYEFHHLASLIAETKQLLLDEKLSRHSLETYVQSLEQDLVHTKSALTSAKVAYDLQLNTTKTDFENKINKLDETIRHLNITLTKEKVNRHQLQQAYTRLSYEFQNLSRAQNSEANAFNDKLKNLTHETITRINSANTAIQLVNRSCTEIMDKEKLEIERVNQTFNGTLSSTLSEIKGINASVGAQLRQIVTNISSLTMDLASFEKQTAAIKNKTAILDVYANVSSAQQNKGLRSAFTADQPYDGSSYLAFRHLITNIGGHFNPSSGVFTCEYPGLYYFSLALYKDVNADHAICRIAKDGTALVVAYSYPDLNAIKNLHGVSNSVVVHLVKGDRVYLSTCSAASSMYSYTSFSGFLFLAD